MAKKSSHRPRRTDADRRYKQAEAVARKLRLLFLLRGRSRWNIKSLAEELADYFGLGKISERTVYRDLKVLEYAGVPVEFDRKQLRYHIRSDFQFPTINLSPDDLLDQVAAAAVASAPGLKVGRGSTAVMERLAAVSTHEAEQLLQEAQAVTQALDLKLADHSRHQEIIRKIQLALIERQLIAGKYLSPYQAEPVQLEIHPYRLCFLKQAWYLIGRPSDADHPRTYRVQRFTSLTLKSQPAQVPNEFDIRAYLGNAWGVFRGPNSFDVTIQFTPEAAPLVTETQWHHTQQADAQHDGSVLLKFRVDGLEEILWWVLGWTGRAKVIAPPQLREMVVAQLQIGLKLHRP